MNTHHTTTMLAMEEAVSHKVVQLASAPLDRRIAARKQGLLKPRHRQD